MMSVDQRHLNFLGDFDDFQYDPSLRIPPLQDPTPFTPSSRPSPLEPNARVNTGMNNATAKLTSRRKALAEATPIGEPEPIHVQEVGITDDGTSSSIQGVRKRQKSQAGDRITDFVQLPKPKAKVQEDKPPPFQPVSVLNELHEPPPSAALFPPITPNASQDGGQLQMQYDRSSQNLENAEQVLPDDDQGREQGKGSGKRLNLRPRHKWTDRETRQLLKGVEIYGLSKWKKILQHAEFSFHPERTSVDLKDRYRTCLASRKVIESMKSTSPPKKTTPHNPEDGDSSNETSFIPVNFPPPNHTPVKPRTSKPKPEKPLGKASVAKVAKRKPKILWTEEEDKSLEKGYREYGFQWSAIAKDPKLKLAHRTGPQVRDRFRIRHREVYRASGSMPLAEEARETSESLEGKDEPRKKGRNNEKPPPFYLENEVDPGAAAFEAENEQGDDHDNDNNDEEEAPNPADQAPHSQPPLGAGILGLLNDEDEEISRLPSFKYSYNDDWGDSGVTLPPLLWEDMATRPIFDLE